MKKADTWMQIIKEDGTRLTPVIRNTEEGQSRYANRVYNKYGEQVTVEQYYFSTNGKCILVATWHA